MDFEEKTIERKEIFKGRIIDVKLDTVELPGGKGHSTRELVLHPGGVSVLAVTDEKKMVLVKQYRKPLERTIYEIPAGKLEVGELSNLTGAILREMEEEVGYTTQDIKLIAEFFVSPGFTNEKTYLFLARNLVRVKNPKPKDWDENLEVYEVDLKTAKEMVVKHEIDDAKTLLAVNYLEKILEESDG